MSILDVKIVKFVHAFCIDEEQEHEHEQQEQEHKNEEEEEQEQEHLVLIDDVSASYLVFVRLPFPSYLGGGEGDRFGSNSI